VSRSGNSILPKHVIFLNDDIQCLETYDIWFKFLGLVLFVASIFLRFAYYNLQKVSTNPLYHIAIRCKSAIGLEITINTVLTATHILSVVAPSNMTKEYKEILVNKY
jgi:phosphatidylserine synthase